MSKDNGSSNGESTERYYAELESHLAEYEEAYFEARPQIDSIKARTLFRAGFDRAFKHLWKRLPVETALGKAVAARDAELQRVYDLVTYWHDQAVHWEGEQKKRQAELAKWKYNCTGKHGSQRPAQEPTAPRWRHDWETLPGPSYRCKRCSTGCLDAHAALLCVVEPESSHAHNWVDGTDPEQQACTGCDSTRMTPEKASDE